MKSLSAGMIAQTQAAAMMPIIFVQLNTPDGNVRYCTGYGLFDWDSQIWTGAGELLNISEIAEGTQTIAAGMAATLSGIDSATVSLALQSVKRYWPAYAWLGALDEDMRVIADPYLLFKGFVDTAGVHDTGESSTITVSAENRLIALRTPKIRRRTDEDQRSERPYDGGFKFVDFLQDARIDFHA